MPRPPARATRATIHAMTSAASCALHRRDVQHPQGLLATRAADGHPRAARAAARAGGGHPVPAGSAATRNERHALRYRDWPRKPQHEFIADEFWHEVAYGKNAVYRARPPRQRGAVALPDARARRTSTSRRTCSKAAACSIARSSSATARRACIASTCTWACSSAAGSGRSARSSSASARRCRDDAPLIIAGDFNDWRSKGDRALTEALGCVEVFEHVTGRPARTFPSLMPMFRLDRIYARGLDVVDARVHYATPGKPHVRPRGARRDIRAYPACAALIVTRQLR